MHGPVHLASGEQRQKLLLHGADSQRLREEVLGDLALSDRRGGEGELLTGVNSHGEIQSIVTAGDQDHVRVFVSNRETTWAGDPIAIA